MKHLALVALLFLGGCSTSAPSQEASLAYTELMTPLFLEHSPDMDLGAQQRVLRDFAQTTLGYAQIRALTISEARMYHSEIGQNVVDYIVRVPSYNTSTSSAVQHAHVTFGQLLQELEHGLTTPTQRTN